MLFGKHHCAGMWAPSETSTTTLVFAAAFLLLTVPGNLLVILAVLRDPNNEMRTPFCGLVLNLAITDFVVGVLVEPMSIAIHYREIKGLSISMSWLSQLTYFLLCTASLLSLTALTIDRYIAITSPLWYRANATFFKSIVASLLLWLVAIGFSVTFFEVGFISYSFVLANISVFFSLTILIFGYVRIFLKLKAELVKLQAFSESESEQNRSCKRAMEREKKLTNTYLLMITVFLVTYGPSCVMVYLMNLCTTCSCEVVHWLRDMHFVFVTANSFVNPLLYAFRLPTFRRAFLRLLGGLPCVRKTHIEPQPSSAQQGSVPASGSARNNPTT